MLVRLINCEMVEIVKRNLLVVELVVNKHKQILLAAIFYCISLTNQVQ